MRDLLIGAVLFVSVVLWAAIMVAVFNFDRITAFLLRPFHHRLFPLAHRIARSLREEPGTWTFERERYRAKHGPSGLSIYTGLADASGLRFETNVGEWKPNFVERRIVRNALNRLARAEVSDLAASYMEPRDRTDRLRLSHEPEERLKGWPQ
ncbi:hypothetical protein ACFQX4_22875 [Roseomonas sp. GCM10028921]